MGYDPINECFAPRAADEGGLQDTGVGTVDVFSRFRALAKITRT